MEVIEVTEREVEIIEVIERGPQGPTGPTGPQGPAGAGGVTSVSGTAPIVSSGGTTPTISVTTGTTANTVAAGDDSRIVGAAQKSANLSDLASASTARTNLGVGSSDAVTFGSIQNTPIGSTTRNTGAFTTLSASGAITAAGTAGTPTTPATALGVQWSGLGGTDIAAVYGTYSGVGKVGIGVGTSGILAEVASFALGGIALNRATTVSNGTITASAPVLDLSQTWNNAAANFTSLRLNATNTASGAATFLADFQVSGSSAFAILKDGTIGRFNASTGAVRSGLFFNGQSANRILVTAGDSPLLYLAPDDLGLAGPAIIRWDSSGGSPTSTGVGLALLRDGANNVLGQRNGTNAQTYNIYNTSSSNNANFERGFMRWSSNVLQLGTEKLGTGSARAMEFQTDGTTRVSVTTGGNFWVNNQLILGTTVLARITSPADGVVTLFDSGQATFNRLQFGGTTSSFPALKRSSTTLQVRLADDSAYTVLDAQHRLQGTAPASATATGTAGDIRYDADYIYVCTAANTWKRAAIATW